MFGGPPGFDPESLRDYYKRISRQQSPEETYKKMYKVVRKAMKKSAPENSKLKTYAIMFYLLSEAAADYIESKGGDVSYQDLKNYFGAWVASFSAFSELRSNYPDIIDDKMDSDRKRLNRRYDDLYENFYSEDLERADVEVNKEFEKERRM